MAASWLAVAYLVALLAPGCASAGRAGEDRPLSETYGTKQFVASGPAVFEAVKVALISQGFVVAIANPARGLIRTAPKGMGVTGKATATEVTVDARAFQVVAQLTTAESRVKVTFFIHHYRNGVDITAREEAPSGERRRLWSQLFEAMNDALPPAAAAPPDDSTVL